jgi:hypothetical protein
MVLGNWQKFSSLLCDYVTPEASKISSSYPVSVLKRLSYTSSFDASSSSNFRPLDWYDDTLPLLTQQLQDLPKVRIELHLPKSILI